MLPVTKLYGVEWQEERRIVNGKGFGRDLSWSNSATIPEFYLEGATNATKTLQSGHPVSRQRFEPSISQIPV
jgi:hypothetical protein